MDSERESRNEDFHQHLKINDLWPRNPTFCCGSRRFNYRNEVYADNSWNVTPTLLVADVFEPVASLILKIEESCRTRRMLQKQHSVMQTVGTVMRCSLKLSKNLSSTWTWANKWATSLLQRGLNLYSKTPTRQPIHMTSSGTDWCLPTRSGRRRHQSAKPQKHAYSCDIIKTLSFLIHFKIIFVLAITSSYKYIDSIHSKVHLWLVSIATSQLQEKTEERRGRWCPAIRFILFPFPWWSLNCFLVFNHFPWLSNVYIPVTTFLSKHFLGCGHYLRRSIWHHSCNR